MNHMSTKSYKTLLATSILVSSLGIYANSATDAARSAVNAAANGNSVMDSISNSVSNFFDGWLTNGVSELLPNAEVSISDAAREDASIQILTVVPIEESEDFKHTTFFQGSLSHQDSRETINLGLGYRQMSDDENWLYGVNGFFDQEFPYNHQRASIGLEARSSAIELNANKYYAISGWENGENSNQEHALDGQDIELGVAIPYMPSSKIYHKSFKWDALNGAQDLKGKTTSLNIRGDILTPGLTLEVGKTNYDGTRADKDFVSLTYKIIPGKTDYQPLIANKPFTFTSMKDKRLDKVRRENKIIKQKKTGSFTASFL